MAPESYRAGRCVTTVDKEVVLPSGKFARIRPLTLGDLVVSYGDNSYLMFAKLASRATTIDGDCLTLDEFLEMDMNDFFLIQQIINANIMQGLATKGGIA